MSSGLGGILGGILGGGGGPGPGPGSSPMGGGFQPRGPYGPWPTCGCSSLFIILAGLLLVFGGCLRMLGM
jgi:hypothetical protein